MADDVTSLEQAVEMFPEIKGFVDYVKETNGQETLKIEYGNLIWSYEKDPDNFYTMSLALDRSNPSMWIWFREGMVGTNPFSEPAKGEELIRKLPEIFDTIKQVYDKCFVRGKDVYQYATPEETGLEFTIAPGLDLS